MSKCGRVHDQRCTNEYCGGCHECCDSKSITTAEALLEKFKQEMLAKLQKRAVKHPDDNFLSMGVEDMANHPLSPITDHMNEEIEELFVARAFDDKGVMKEDVDVANMAFIEWAFRWARDNGCGE